MRKLSLIGVLLVVSIAGAVVAYRFYTREAPGTPAIVMLPPAQAVGFIATPGLPQAWADIRQSQFYQQVSSPAFWQRALGPNGYQQLNDAKQQLEQRLGLPLTEPTIDLLLNREFGIALIPNPQRPVDVVVYARVSGVEKVAESLGRVFSGPPSDVVRDTESLDGIEIVTLRPKNAPTSVSYALLGNLVVLSTQPAWVIDAIKAQRGLATDRLHTTPAFQALQLPGTERLLAYGYYDAARLEPKEAAGDPVNSHPPQADTLQLLQRTGTVRLKATRVAGGMIIDTIAVPTATAASQNPLEVVADGAAPAFDGVPAETFYLMHVDLRHLQRWWQRFSPLAEEAYAEFWPQLLEAIRARLGVDLERDVLPVLTGAMSLGITAPFNGPPNSPISLPGVFLAIGLTDESKGRQLIQTIGTHAAGPRFTDLLQRQTYDGQTIYALTNPLLLIRPGYAISRQQLLVGSDVGLLQQMLDGTAGKATTLAATPAYQEVRQQFRIKAGNLTFIDVGAAIQQVRLVWTRYGTLLQTLLQAGPGVSGGPPLPGDVAALAELLRPVRYLGVASQTEPQGLHTETFIAIQDLPPATP